MTTSRLIQLSDCHISADENALYRGLPALASLRALVPAIQAFGPARILATGDLSEDGSAESYGHFRAVLEPLGLPVHCLPGNHDEPDVMNQALPAEWLGRAVDDQPDGWRIIMANSKDPDSPAGLISAAELQAIGQAIEEAGARPVMLCLHHQPQPSGSHWIDRYPLNQAGALLDLVQSAGSVRVVCWGHVHHAWRREQDGRLWVSAPSTVANTQAPAERFTADPAGPAVRWYSLHPGGGVESGLLRLAQGALGSTSQRIR